MARDNKMFAQRLLSGRLAQDVVADAAGVTLERLGRIERGNSAATPEEAERIAAVINNERRRRKSVDPITGKRLPMIKVEDLGIRIDPRGKTEGRPPGYSPRRPKPTHAKASLPRKRDSADELTD